MTKKIKFSTLTWKEVDELSRDTVIFLPIGTVEQNGPHSPLQTDTILVQAFADKVADKLDAKVLDLIPYSYSETFQNFPGTIFLRPETFSNLIIDICSSLIKNGFKKIILINQHMPNQGIIEHSLREIRNRFGVVLPLIFTAKVIDVLNYKLIDKTLNGHGGEPLNSILLHLKPEIMRMDLAKKGTAGSYKGLEAKGSTTVMFKDCPVNIFLNMDEVSTNGTYGDPTQSDPAKGKELFDRLVNWGVEFVKEFSKL